MSPHERLPEIPINSLEDFKEHILGGEPMAQTESRKGTECPYRPILCQEGWCNDCRIYRDWIGHQRTMGRMDNEICLRCGASRTALKEMMADGSKGNLTIVNHILENCPACALALGGKG